METPCSSSRRITRSQALAMAANNSIPISSRKTEESEKGVLKSRQGTNGGKQEERERSALFDITNDSPIVGLAIGNLKTPSSTFSKKMMIIQNSQSKQATTPGSGSGEALLRGQVKTLLQKVEEEAVISKISFEPRNLIYEQGCFVNSPMHLLAPTPANTPQVLEFSENINNGSESLTVSPVAESFNFSQMLEQQEEKGETEEKSLITKLFTDFHVDPDHIKSSVDDEDDASIWSIQVNASTSDEHEDDEELEEDYTDEEDEGVDELCEVLSNISVNGAAKFTGKHKRFVYDSDGELEAEEDVFEASSPLCLKGLPTPKGKHLRFPDES